MLPWGGKHTLRVWAWFLLIVCVALVPACRSKKPVEPEVLRIGMLDSPETLDPHKRNALGTSNIIGQMYESLVSYDRNLGLMPGLAESWENPEENRWRFHIRKNVSFHTGKILDAYDVEATLQRLKKDRSLEMSSYVSHVTDVRVLDPYQIEITTSRLSISTLNRLLYVYILPKDYTQCEGKWDRISCGTGPYRLMGWKNDQVSMVRFGAYWRKKPAFESVEYHFYNAASPLMDALEKVPLQCAKLDGSPIPPEVSRNYRIESQESLYVVYLGFNLGHKDMLFESQDQRDLLNDSLDRQRIVDEARYGHATITVQLVPPYVYGFDPAVKLVSFRKKESQFGPHREMQFLVRRLFAPVGQALQRQFDEMHIRTKMIVLPDSEFFARLRSDDYDVFISRWGCVTTDASELFENCFYRHGVREGYGITNYTHYGTEETDKEIDSSGLIGDPQQRIKQLQKVLDHIAGDRVWIPLYINHDVYAVSRTVNWQPRLDSRVNAYEFESIR